MALEPMQWVAETAGVARPLVQFSLVALPRQGLRLYLLMPPRPHVGEMHAEPIRKCCVHPVCS